MSSFVPRLNLVGDVSPGDWLGGDADDMGVKSSGVPRVFPAYVQLLHPARGRGDGAVRWQTVADWLEQPLLPGVWFQDLEEFAASRAADDRPWEQAPHLGEIPQEILDVLVPKLGGHTASAHGWFCLWDGWGFLNGSMQRGSARIRVGQQQQPIRSRSRSLPAFPPSVLKGPKVQLPFREYFLFEGPLDAVNELGAWISWEPDGDREFEQHTPSLWWPDDRAWCAGNEIDAGFTCIGGPRALIDELLRHPELETLELDPGQRFSPYSDLSGRPLE